MRRCLGAVLLLFAAAWAQEIDIPYQKFTLGNGLTLIVQEDHKAPIAAVNVSYHVGSKNEKRGRTGFAHLFEHLMFGGSEHFRSGYIDAMERVGATDPNGTTSADRTNYFENVPTSALDYALWMESDRMGHLLGAIDQKVLDLQRGVVANEKRQDENEPYGERVWELIARSTYPAAHPYSWEVIGSMDDLNAATLEDVREWFKTYYGPNNAVLVVAGDVDPQAVKQKVEKYFGDIPPGPPITRERAWVAKMTGTHRGVLQDRVPQARVYMVWNTPETGSEDSDSLDLVSDVFSQGKTSRLYKRLVYDDQIATDIAAFVMPREIGQQFVMYATARPGVELARVEEAIDQERAHFLEAGPTAEEVERVRTQSLANFIRGIDRIGGFGGTSDVLATSQVFLGSPDAYKLRLQRVRTATPARLREAARRWLSDGVYILEVRPFGDPKASPVHADRTRPPAVGAPPELRLPKLERTTLSNGLKVVLAERHEIPVVNFWLLVDAGYAADHSAAPGTARLASSLLDGGTRTRTALQISGELARLGAQLSAFSEVDTTIVRLSALTTHLGASLELYADVILNPVFPETDFQRQQKLQLAAIAREKATPAQMALRIFPGLLYGQGHAYSEPLTGSGTAASVAKLTRQDLARFHDTWFKPNHATLVVVGDASLRELRPRLESLFAGWKPGTAPAKAVAAVLLAKKPAVYVVDRPGAVQSVIMAGNLAPPRNNPDEIAIESMNNILGGTFGARINMNLREDKHWSYGASSLLFGARGQRPFLVFAPVEADKTKEALSEIDKELRGMLGSRPPTQEELARVKANETLQLPGSQESLDQAGNSINTLVEYGLPDDYYQTYARKVRALTLADIEAAARRVIHPESLVWVVVGDRSKIEAGIRQLGFGEVSVLNEEGQRR